MIRLACVLWIALLCACPPGAQAHGDEGCFADEVVAHVKAQFIRYGGRSEHKEYFGFIYRIADRIESAVTASGNCLGQPACAVKPVFALRQIPRGAKVLGEWHTHPRAGTNELSSEDVMAVHANRRLRCYAAFYSGANGDIWQWSANADSVATAMASRTRLGNFHSPL